MVIGMYDSYGRYIGYPVWIIEFCGHKFEKTSKKDVDSFIARLEEKYARIGKTADGKYSITESWHSGL
jgi:hypothetical protein